MKILKREKDNIKKKQMELQEIKKISAKMKIPLDGINNRLDTSEKNSELEYAATKTIQTEAERGKKKSGKQMNRASVICTPTSVGLIQVKLELQR